MRGEKGGRKRDRVCVGNAVDKSFGGILLVDCYEDEDEDEDEDKDEEEDEEEEEEEEEKESEGKFNLSEDVGLFEEKGGEYRLLNGGSGKGEKECLTIVELENNGGTVGVRGGSQLGLGPCGGGGGGGGSTEFQMLEGGALWEPKLDVCLTSGWPFLQAGAFDRNGKGRGGVTVVVLNEGGEDVQVDVEAAGMRILVRANSISTMII